MPEKVSDPKDVADMLEALAKRIRGDPTFSRKAAEDRQAVSVALAAGLAGEEGPSLGALDVFTDDRNVTVTVETRNAEATSVHVSLLEGRLLIGLGDGPLAFRRDLPLPAAVDEENAVATFRNGILDVVLPLKR
ncbi:MAG TPA: Hsp20/alpha crystallin family protein [Candidatus Thermoplasmatota archaeon]|nr:Hsp20/alpha crystallin family protein [Candidatus Thermoplasmatota archaeon]